MSERRIAFLYGLATGGAISSAVVAIMGVVWR